MLQFVQDKLNVKLTEASRQVEHTFSKDSIPSHVQQGYWIDIWDTKKSLLFTCYTHEISGIMMLI